MYYSHLMKLYRSKLFACLYIEIVKTELSATICNSSNNIDLIPQREKVAAAHCRGKDNRMHYFILEENFMHTNDAMQSYCIHFLK